MMGRGNLTFSLAKMENLDGTSRREGVGTAPVREAETAEQLSGAALLTLRTPRPAMRTF